MRKIVLTLLFLSMSIFAEEWLDYNETLAKAKDENKIVVLMLSQEGCPACEYMRNMMIENNKISKELNKDFVVVELDIHEDKIPSKFKYFATPTFYFTDKSGKILDVVYGRLKSKAFMTKLKEIERK